MTLAAAALDSDGASSADRKACPYDADRLAAFGCITPPDRQALTRASAAAGAW